MVKKKDNKNNNNSSNSLVFGRWPKTKIGQTNLVEVLSRWDWRKGNEGFPTPPRVWSRPHFRRKSAASGTGFGRPGQSLTSGRPWGEPTWRPAGSRWRSTRQRARDGSSPRRQSYSGVRLWRRLWSAGTTSSLCWQTILIRLGRPSPGAPTGVSWPKVV